MKYLALLLSLVATPSLADAPSVEQITATRTASGWTFSVTLRHEDTGWDDYADGWRIETSDGEELGIRVLAHPHVTEQPFTRSQSGIVISDNITTVYIRARTNVEGWAESRTEFKLP